MGTNYFIGCEDCRVYLEIGRKALLYRRDPQKMLALEKFLFDHTSWGESSHKLTFFGDNDWQWDIAHDCEWTEHEPAEYVKDYKDYLFSFDLARQIGVACPDGEDWAASRCMELREAGETKAHIAIYNTSAVTGFQTWCPAVIRENGSREWPPGTPTEAMKRVARENQRP